MEGTALRVVTHPPAAVEALAEPYAGERTTVVHIASGDLWAGAEVQLFNLACALDADPQIRLFVILLNHGLLAQRLHERGVSVQVFDEGRLNIVQILARVHHFLLQVRPDIVHTHREKENVIGAVAARLAGAGSIRTVHGLSEHPPRPWQLQRRLTALIDRACARHLQARIIAVSPELAGRLRAGGLRGKIRVVENGIDVDQVRHSAASPVDLPGDANVVRIALVARLVPVKRVDVFLATAAMLHARQPGQFQFYILGDGPLMEEARQDIIRRGLQGQVFLLGFRDPVAPYLARMDLLLITSDHEGLPMNLLEAMSLEVPVIAHAVGGVPRILDHGRCGVLVHRQQPEAYADAIMTYLTHRALFLQQARAGHARLRTRYSALANARVLKSLYAELSNRAETGQTT